MQEIKEEPLYYIHYANAFDDGDEVVLRGSAWGPEDVKKLAASPRNGILGSWDDLMEGNFTAVRQPACHSSERSRCLSGMTLVPSLPPLIYVCYLAVHVFSR